MLALTLLVGGLSSAFAQGTLDFAVDLSGANEVPTNASPGFGSGTLHLDGTTLSYVINMSISFQDGAEPTGVTINGPADTSSTAPMLFDLGTPTLITIQPPPGSYYSSGGTINNLTSTQIDDLLAGLWYVNVFTSSGTFPEGEIRGQIVPVPEPSTWALLASGGVVVWWNGRQKRKG